MFQHIKAGVRPHIHPTARFRSSWEANYGLYLNTLAESGVIHAWHHEPQTFWFDGIKRGCVSYLPDFRITRPDGSIYFVEIKGRWDQKSRTKLKRMAKYHPTVELVIVDTKAYKALEKELGQTIPRWELPAKKSKNQ